MRVVSRAGLGAAAIAGVLCMGTSAHAYLSSLTAPQKCLAAKVKTITKGASAYAGCYSKGAGKLIATDPVCLSKVSTKNTSAFAKLDLKPPCLTTGDGPARDTDTANYASSLDAAVGHNGKCDAAKIKTVGKYVAAIGGCYAKAAGKLGVVDNAVGGCTDKALGKLNAAIAKIELKPPCTTTGNAAALRAAADAYIQSQACALDPGNPGCGGPTCGNGVVNAGEDCDTAGGPATSCQTVSNTAAGFTCSGSCQCACPTSVTFSGNASDPASILDSGWTGISHRAPIISNGDVTINISGCAGSRPCGTCNVSGPVENPNAGAGQLHTRRCSNDSSIKCLNNAACGAGTCEYYFGSNLALAAGGVGTCVVNTFVGSVSGTANIESGEAATVANLTARVYTGPTDNPCPRCSDAGAFNDNNPSGGTCDSGPRIGLPCDANGFVPGRPDFGRTSLDCPPPSGNLAATLPIDLTNETNPVTKTLSASSPNCTDGSGDKCLCETCNNAAATPCDSNADCVAAGATVCGGKRCIGGTNNGGVCNNVTACPGGGLCGTAGEPSKPSACLDDTSTPVFDCSDTAPVDQEGECTNGPVTKTCSVASGHGQRACSVDADCAPGGAGSCVAGNRACFLTGNFVAPRVGTNTLIAVGMEDLPMNDTSNPTLGAVFCIGPTSASAVNTVAGLPGPGRITIKGTAVGKP